MYINRQILTMKSAFVSLLFVCLMIADGCDASPDAAIDNSGKVVQELPKAYSGKKIFLDGVVVTASASSELEPDSERYAVDNLFDGDRSSAWCEGGDGDGVSESISMVFDEPRLVSSIIFDNGYQKNTSIFMANNRASQVRLDFDKGASGTFHAVQLGKVTTVQVHKFVSEITLSIEQVERGNKYNDLCLSEIALAFDKHAELRGADCTELLYPEGMPWGYCVNNKNIDVFSLNSEKAVYDSISIDEYVRDDMRFLRLVQEPDFVNGKVLLFKLSAQYDYDRDVFLHFVSSAGDLLLLFRQASMGDDGGFEYAFEGGDLNGDALLDVIFSGQCYYPDGCPGFVQSVQYISSDGNYLTERIVK